jgi:hypothetical protein
MLPLVNSKNGKKTRKRLLNSLNFFSREFYLEDTLKKRNIEFRALEEQLRQFEEKVIDTYSFNSFHEHSILDTNF